MRFTHAVLVAAILGLLVLSTPLSVQQAQMGVYNDQADGAGHLFEPARAGGWVPTLTWQGTPVHLLHGDLARLQPQGEALIILDPRTTYSGGEVQALRGYLEDGGRALVAADGGAGRDLVEALELGVTITGASYYTPVYERTPRFPIAETTGAVEGLPDRVVHSQPSIVDGPGTPVLTSPEPAWRDEDRDARPDLSEPHGTFATARIVTAGEGRLLVVGDPSLFTQALADENPGTADALIAWAAQDGQRRIVVDEAHRATADPIGVASLMAGDPPGTTVALLTGAGVLMLVTATMRLRVTRRNDDRRALRGPRDTSPAERAVIEELEAANR